MIDDFVRNFLLKMGMSKTLEMFETEWYELASTGRLAREEMGAVPDVYMRNMELDDSLKQLQAQLENARGVAAKATSTWDKFRKVRSGGEWNGRMRTTHAHRNSLGGWGGFISGRCIHGFSLQIPPPPPFALTGA